MIEEYWMLLTTILISLVTGLFIGLSIRKTEPPQGEESHPCGNSVDMDCLEYLHPLPDGNDKPAFLKRQAGIFGYDSRSV